MGGDEGEGTPNSLYFVHPHAQRRRLRRVPAPSPIEGGGDYLRISLPEGPSHRKRSDNLDRTFFRLGTKGHTTAAEPAFIRVKLDGRLSFYRIGRQLIAHADINACVTARTRILVVVDRFERHSVSPIKRLSRVDVINSKHEIRNSKQTQTTKT